MVVLEALVVGGAEGAQLAVEDLPLIALVHHSDVDLHRTRRAERLVAMSASVRFHT